MAPGNVALFGKPHQAHGASVGLLAGVGPLVRRTGAFLSEPHRAHGASVGLLARVGPLVRRNGALVAEPP